MDDKNKKTTPIGFMSAEDRGLLCSSLLSKQGEYLAYAAGVGARNTKCGGAAYLILDYNGTVVRSAHRCFDDTNTKRMELLAVVSAVAATPKNSRLIIQTDSEYAISSFRLGCGRNKDLAELFHKYENNLEEVDFVHIRETNSLNDWCKGWAQWEFNQAKAMTDGK